MDEFEMLIKRVVPSHADIDVRQQSGRHDLTYEVNWFLKDDGQRLNKKSKTIAVLVPYEMTQDLPDFPGTIGDQVAERLLRFLTEKYATFDPKHNTDQSTPPPVERWIVPSSVWS